MTPKPAQKTASMKAITSIICAAVAISINACDSGSAQAETHNELEEGQMQTSVSAEQEWIVLFDGKTLNGWHPHQQPGTLPENWVVEDGVITRIATGPDLVTEREFANFEFEFEWRIEKGGNTGVFYRLNPDVEVTYHSAPEYQVLDDEAHRDGLSRLTSAGAAYGLYPAPEGHTKPIGEWNSGRIVVDGNKVEHWLNEVRLLSYELWSSDWEEKVKNSKFGAWPPYGRSASGKIGLQEHGGKVGFRNLRIKVLP